MDAILISLVTNSVAVPSILSCTPSSTSISSASRFSVAVKFAWNMALVSRVGVPLLQELPFQVVIILVSRWFCACKGMYPIAKQSILSMLIYKFFIILNLNVN